MSDEVCCESDVALQDIFNPNCRVDSLFQGPPSYVFANYDVLGEWKILLMITEIVICP